MDRFLVSGRVENGREHILRGRCVHIPNFLLHVIRVHRKTTDA